MPSHHLAQLNIGQMVAPKGDPAVAGFFDALERINAIADAAPGFVWRLVDEAGADATSLRPYGDDLLVNLSVWRDLDALRAFTYRTEHLDVLRRRREWFVPLGRQFMVNWWVPAGHLPTLTEAGERLELLRSGGPSARAFTFRDPYPAP